MKSLHILIAFVVLLMQFPSVSYAIWSNAPVYTYYLSVSDIAHSKSISPIEELPYPEFISAVEYPGINVSYRSSFGTRDLDSWSDPFYYPDKIECYWEIKRDSTGVVVDSGDDLSFTWVPSEGGTYTLTYKTRDTGRPESCNGCAVCDTPHCYRAAADDMNPYPDWDYAGYVKLIVLEAKISQVNRDYDTNRIFIPTNDDDDNENGIIDLNDSALAENDDEITQLQVTAVGEGAETVLSLHWNYDDEEPPVVRIMTDKHRGGTTYGSGDNILGSADGSYTLWLEGVRGSFISGEGWAVDIHAYVRVQQKRYDNGTLIADTDSVDVHPASVDFNLFDYCDWFDGDNADIAELGTGAYPNVGIIIPYNKADNNDNGIYDRNEEFPWAGFDKLLYNYESHSFHPFAPYILEELTSTGKIRVRLSNGERKSLPYTENPDDNYTIEGIGISDSPGDVLLRYKAKLPGPANYWIHDDVRFTVVDVDLDIDGRTELQEEINPRPMAVNDDDDNQNRICDYSFVENYPLSNEDETVQLTLSAQPLGLFGLWSLSGWRDPLDFWTAQTKDMLLFPLGTIWRSTPLVDSPWIECLTPGTHSTNLTYEPSYTSGPYSSSYVCTQARISDSITIDGLDPDISMAGLSDCDEMAVGGFVCLNDNDNDGVMGVDHDHIGVTTDPDPDLVWVQISFTGPCDTPLPRSIELSGGSGKIRAWTNRNKQNAISLPHIFNFDSDMRLENGRYITDIYIEGVATSGSVRDTELRVKYTRDGIDFVDKMKLTVVDVVIDAPAFGQDKAVLISKTPGMGDDYPDPTLQTEDRKIRIEAHTVPRIADLPVYFACWDPDDESPYETEAGPDNADGLGTIYAVPGYVYEGDPGSTLAVYSDSNGDIKVKLQVTGHCAGDNYVLTAKALQLPDDTEDSTSKLVAWKRVYLEIDRMYRMPGYTVLDDNPELCPSSQVIGAAEYGTYYIYLDNISNFNVGEEVVIFDGVAPDGESNYVQEKGVNEYGSYLRLAFLLNRTYVGGYGSGGRGAAVRKVDAPWFSESMTSRLSEAYGTISDLRGASVTGCFIDFRLCPYGHNHVPYMVLDSFGIRDAYSECWFANRGMPNTIHLLLVDMLDPGVKGFSPPLDGSYYSLNWCYVSWRVATRPEAMDIPATAVHELFHQFSGSSDVDDNHLATWSLAGDPNRCVMQYEPGGGNSYNAETMPCQFCLKHVYDVRRAADGL